MIYQTSASGIDTTSTLLFHGAWDRRRAGQVRSGKLFAYLSEIGRIERYTRFFFSTLLPSFLSPASPPSYFFLLRSFPGLGLEVEFRQEMCGLGLCLEKDNNTVGDLESLEGVYDEEHSALWADPMESRLLIDCYWRSRGGNRTAIVGFADQTRWVGKRIS